jgi:hypothetical protein
MAKQIRRDSDATDQADREMRKRIDAFTLGKKPTKEMVAGSIVPLLRKIDREVAHRIAIEKDADRKRRAIDKAMRPSGKPNRSELEALKSYREEVLRSAKPIQVKPPKVTPVPPQIRSGSIWVGFSPPYTDRWTSGSNAVANHLVGTWSTGSSDVNTSLAGICTFFTPVPGRFNVRFAPYMPISYDFWIDAYQLNFPPSPVVSRASSSGFVGAYVTAWDGRQWVEMVDARNTIWDRRVSINDDVGDSGDTAWYTPQAVFPTFGNPLTFALWAWGGVSTWTQDGTFGVGVARASIAASVPFMIVEQMI